MVFLIGIAASFATFLGGLFALHLKDRMHLILGFSAGAVVGVAFFDLIPEAIEIVGATRDSSFAMMLIATGFVTYMLLDRFVVLHRHHEHHAHEHAHVRRGAWGAGTLSVHSFLDGLGIGFAFQVSPLVGAVVAAAVLAHDFSDGINTVNMVVKNGGTRTQALRWLLVDASAPFLGVMVASLFGISESGLGIILSLFAGFFLYIGASDLVPESHHTHPVYWTTFATVLGIACMYFAIMLAH